MRILFSLVVSLWILTPLLKAQYVPPRGVPKIETFGPQQTNYHGKIWEIRAADNRLLYFAGDQGLLIFDGYEWENHRGSKGYTRSVCVDSDTSIYTGSDQDFGKWVLNDHSEWIYTSLYPYKNNPGTYSEEFWATHKLKDRMVFLSFQHLYVLNKEHITQIPAPHRISASRTVKGTLYIADDKKGVFTFDGKDLNLLFTYPPNTKLDIVDMYPTSSGLLIITKKNGLFEYRKGKLHPVRNEISTRLVESQVLCYEKLQGNHHAFGTILEGLYIANKEGRIVQHIQRSNGLQNNTVLSMCSGPGGKLWMGLDYGIANVHLKSKTTFIIDYSGAFGTAHTSTLEGDRLYLGTNQGLYIGDWDHLGSNVDNRKQRFSLISGSQGQVWTLNKVNQQLLCGHDKGLFEVRKKRLQPIDDKPGVWTILPYDEDFLLTGNYNGIHIYKKNNEGWSFEKKMEDIVGSCNQLLIQDENILWVNIPNFGIVRAKLDHDFNPSERKNFLIETFEGDFPFLQRKDHSVQVCTEKSTYTYNTETHAFVKTGPSPSYADIQQINLGLTFPKVLDSSYTFYPLHNGFALDYRDGKTMELPKDALVLFRDVSLFNNNVKHSLYKHESVPSTINNLSFRFCIPNTSKASYRYRVSPFIKSWSSWSSQINHQLYDLPSGKYSLEVQGKIGEHITPTNTLAFTIRTPWYRSIYSIPGYFALLLIIGFFFSRWQDVQMKRQKLELLKKKRTSLNAQAQKYRRKVLLQKQSQLQNEKLRLEEQVKSKTIELARKAKDLKDLNGAFEKIKENLIKAQNNPKLAGKHIANTLRWMEDHQHLDEDRTFELQMDELHQEFFKALKKMFPELSIYDLRLCAYLKIGLNSKEISEILNVLPSSINVSRSRLRKKLKLDAKDNLFDFLNSI